MPDYYPAFVNTPAGDVLGTRAKKAGSRKFEPLQDGEDPFMVSAMCLLCDDGLEPPADGEADPQQFIIGDVAKNGARAFRWRTMADGETQNCQNDPDCMAQPTFAAGLATKRPGGGP